MSTQCRFCGEAVRPDSMFCPACGQLIGAVAGAVPPFPGGDAAPSVDDPAPAAPAPTIEPVPLPAPRRPAPKQDAPSPADVPPVEQKSTSAKRTKKKPAEQNATVQAPSSLVLPDGQRLAIDRVLVLGRSPEQGAAAYNGTPVRLDDPERAMSRVHLIVSPSANGVTATDPGSANGTLLERDGAQYALVSSTPTNLVPGDRLILGDATLTFA